jgi:hypothetical protein
MIRINGHGGGVGFISCCSPHVTRTALFPSPPTRIVAQGKNGALHQSQIRGEGSAVPRYPGHDSSNISGLEVTTKDGDMNAPQEEEGKVDNRCAL